MCQQRRRRSLEEAFDQLVASDYYKRNEILLAQLIDYFEDNYIGRLTRTGRRTPIFPKNLWNVYDSAVEELPKTINNVEGWHNAFGTIVGACHLNIWKFIQAIPNTKI